MDKNKSAFSGEEKSWSFQSPLNEIFDDNFYISLELTRMLRIDVSVPWHKWGWGLTGGWQTYECALMEEFRNRIILSYRLLDRINFAHLLREVDGLPPDAHILDAGGGTGRLALPLARSGFTNITLIDIAPGWLKLANEKINRAQFENQITSLRGDIRNMRMFPDNSVDFSFALGGVISYCRGGERAVRELYRVTKAGGKILIDAHNKLFAEILRVKEGDLTPSDERESRKVRGKKSPSGSLASDSGELLGIEIESFLPEEFVRLLKSVGFEDIVLMSQYNFLPDDTVKVSPETKKWEELVIRTELKHCADPRYLASGGLIASARKPERSGPPISNRSELNFW